MPYSSTGGKSSYAADGTSNASFAVMADKNPYLDPKISNPITTAPSATTWQDSVYRMGVYYTTNASYSEISFHCMDTWLLVRSIGHNVHLLAPHYPELVQMNPWV